MGEGNINTNSPKCIRLVLSVVWLHFYHAKNRRTLSLLFLISVQFQVYMFSKIFKVFESLWFLENSHFKTHYHFSCIKYHKCSCFLLYQVQILNFIKYENLYLQSNGHFLTLLFIFFSIAHLEPMCYITSYIKTKYFN